MFKNREGQVRSGWVIAGVIFSALIITLITTIAIGVVVVLYYLNKTGGNVTEAAMQAESAINIIGIWVQQTAFILVPLITWKFILKRSLSSMGLGPLKTQGKDLVVGLLFGALSITLVFVILVLTGHAKIVSSAPRFSMDQLYSLLVFIAVGFSEEVYGRGFVMSVLRQTKSKWIAVLVSAIIFALLHSLNPGIGIIPYANLFLTGVLFSYMYLLSGNIWMCIGYHITWNYFQGNVFGFLVSGNSTPSIVTTVIEKETILNGGAFGPEGGLAVTLIVLLGFLFVRCYYRNTNYNFLADAVSD